MSMNLFRSLKLTFVLLFSIKLLSFGQYFDDSENVKKFFEMDLDFKKVLNTKSIKELERLSSLERVICYNDSLFSNLKSPENYVQEYLYLKNLFHEKNYEKIISYKPVFLKDSIGLIYKIFLGYSFLYLKDYEKSIEVSSKFSGDFSEILKIICLYRLTRFDECIKSIEKFQNFSSYPEILKLYIHLNYTRKNFEKLDDLCDLFFEKYKGDEDYNYILYIKGQILFKKGYFKRSLKFINQVILNEVKDSVLIGNAYYLAGKNYFMLGDYDRMENYLNVFRESNIASDFKKNALFLDGKGFFLKGDYRKAIKKLKNFSKDFPDDELSTYADQMIAESYFNLKNYKKFKEYLKKRNYPDFINEKLIFLKYFVDYKDGLYPDSISSYISFIENEKSNPFRKNAYERIIEETNSDSIKLFYLKNYLIEFNGAEKVYQIFEKSLVFLYENTSYEFFLKFFKNMDFSSERVDKLFLLLISEIYNKKKDYLFVVKMTQNFLDNIKFYKDEIEYIFIKSLGNLGNYDAALTLVDKKLKVKNDFYDSLYMIKFSIYSEKNDVENLTNVVESYDGGNIYLEAELNRVLAEKFYSIKMFQQAKEYFRKALVLYGDDREKVALVLTELAETHYALDEKENASIIAQQALFFTRDVNLINRIKLIIEK